MCSLSPLLTVSPPVFPVDDLCRPHYHCKARATAMPLVPPSSWSCASRFATSRIGVSHAGRSWHTFIVLFQAIESGTAALPGMKQHYGDFHALVGLQVSGSVQTSSSFVCTKGQSVREHSPHPLETKGSPLPARWCKKGLEFLSIPARDPRVGTDALNTSHRC